MGLFNFFKPPVRYGNPDWHGLEFDIDDERIPEAIRDAIQRDYRPGYILYYTNTNMGGEWWLVDGDNLIEAYWQ